MKCLKRSIWTTFNFAIKCLFSFWWEVLQVLHFLWLANLYCKQQFYFINLINSGYDYLLFDNIILNAKFGQFVILGKFYLRKKNSSKTRSGKTRLRKTRSGKTHTPKQSKSQKYECKHQQLKMKFHSSCFE